MAEHFIGVERLSRIIRLVNEMKDPLTYWQILNVRLTKRQPGKRSELIVRKVKKRRRRNAGAERKSNLLTFIPGRRSAGFYSV